jgi:hypothetical protein
MGKTIVDGAVSCIDAIFYTDEEKAVAKQKASDTVLKFWDTIARENTEQSQARRILARMTFQVFFFFLLAGAGLFKFDSEWSSFMFQCADKLMFLVSAIGVIYFGPHQLSKVANWKKQD